MKAGRVIGVIPSRWGSTRFPGKALVEIGGKTLLARVIGRVKMARRLGMVYVATDDERIAAEARAAGVVAVMTRAGHASGTDRIAEAVAGLEGEVVVNIQGDEPLVDPGLIDRVAGVLADGEGWDMATAAAPLVRAEDLHDPDVVKVVRGAGGEALYFSRAPIPFRRGFGDYFGPVAGVHLRHIGLYGYRREFLERLVGAGPCALERAEKLEQLRALHLGCRMAVLDAGEAGVGVDRPEDVARVEALLRERGEG